ncbi:hypothetical protein fugu_001877 [Takifugu bimaculatus]|uniref:Uncharacterized protein n=1 Tax=Takifugu bimaculatus TaxID=433685 RepID=A0A4Z2BN23_9TELE|nr:hypothetical protein fugu_001877 [Takifugu bimaculatus]
MPFCKRTILPRDVCKPAGRRLQQEAQRRAALEDLVDVCGVSLCSLLRQLSDLSRHSVSILEELEGDLATICHRSCVLEGRVVRLQRRVTDPDQQASAERIDGSSNFVSQLKSKQTLESKPPVERFVPSRMHSINSGVRSPAFPGPQRSECSREIPAGFFGEEGGEAKIKLAFLLKLSLRVA